MKNERHKWKDHIIENCIFASFPLSCAGGNSTARNLRSPSYWKSIEIREVQVNHKMIATCAIRRCKRRQSASRMMRIPLEQSLMRILMISSRVILIHGPLMKLITMSFFLALWWFNQRYNMFLYRFMFIEFYWNGS